MNNLENITVDLAMHVLKVRHAICPARVHHIMYWVVQVH